jgi:hypothetical protein
MVIGCIFLTWTPGFAQKAENQSFYAEQILQDLEKAFPSLRENETLKEDMGRQITLQLLEGHTYQETLARFKQIVSYQFDKKSEQNEREQQHRREALRNLQRLQIEQDILGTSLVKGWMHLHLPGSSSRRNKR